MKIRIAVVAVVIASTLAASSAQATKKRNLVKSPGPPIVFELHTVEPEVGTEATALPGETLFVEFQGFEQQAAVMEEDFEIWDDHTVRKGEVLLGYIGNKNREIYCSPFRNRKIRLAFTQFNGWDCLLETVKVEQPKHYFDKKQVYQLEGDHGPTAGLRKPPAFHYTRVVPEPEDAAWIAEQEGFALWRKEIVYQGTAGGVLRLMYREYGEDLSEPERTQELVFDLAPEGETTTAVVQGAFLEVYSSDNTGIRYKVTRGF